MVNKIMKILKKIFIIIFLIILSNVPTSALAQNEYLKDNYDYVIKSYKVDIIVNENNTLKITEIFDAYYNIEKHGIIRKIPIENKVKRLDGTTSKNRAKISDLYVNEDYSLGSEYGYKVIKIGNSNVTLTGPKSYVISYLYDLGIDTLKGKDEFYFNLIVDELNTIIINISFNIKMTK